MPLVQTRDFGELEYDAATEWIFPRGLPGFEDQKRFLLMEREGQAPIVYLQSLETPGVCFLAISVWVADPGYQAEMTLEDMEMLGLPRQPKPDGGTLCVAILSGSGETFTANLLAPVVMNLATRTGLQAVRADAAYSYRHPLKVEPVCS
jgi:flagellar assembly factor FliW